MKLNQKKSLKIGDSVYFCFGNGIITGLYSDDEYPILGIHPKGKVKVLANNFERTYNSIGLNIRYVFLTTDHIKEVSKFVFNETKRLGISSYEAERMYKRVHNVIENYWNNMCSAEGNAAIYQDFKEAFITFMKQLKEVLNLLDELTEFTEPTE